MAQETRISAWPFLVEDFLVLKKDGKSYCGSMLAFILHEKNIFGFNGDQEWKIAKQEVETWRIRVGDEV